MKRQRALLLIFIVSMTAVVIATVWPTGPRPCLATFGLVTEGMTREEVAATVGAPPGFYARRPGNAALHYVSGRDLRTIWCADDGALVVWFDEDYRASRVQVVAAEPDTRTFAQQLRSRLRF